MKSIVRSFFSALSFFIFGVGAILIALVTFPLIFIFVRSPKKRRGVYVSLIKSSWIFFVWVMSAFRLIKVKVDHPEKLKNLESTIVVANHPSLIDVVILVSIIPRPVCVVKRKAAENFFMKHMILKAYIKNDEENFISNCQDSLYEGYNLILFPEGTRSMPDCEMKLKRGVAYIAMENHSPILPIRINVSEQVLGKHQKFYKVSDETVRYDLIVKDIIATDNIVDTLKSRNINARRICDEIKFHIEK